jgi:hypothetical protein
MTANDKIHIAVTANYNDGTFLCQEHTFIAETILHVFHETGTSVLEVRILLPSQDAAELLRGMMMGKTELLVERIPPMLDEPQSGI